MEGGGGAGTQDFVAAAKFAGSRPGFCFRTGVHGLGYYLDPRGSAAMGGDGDGKTAGLDEASDGSVMDDDVSGQERGVRAAPGAQEQGREGGGGSFAW